MVTVGASGPRQAGERGKRECNLQELQMDQENNLIKEGRVFESLIIQTLFVYAV